MEGTLDVTCPLRALVARLDAMRKHLGKLQGQRAIAAREVLELVGVAEELQQTVALPNTRQRSSGAEGA